MDSSLAKFDEMMLEQKELLDQNKQAADGGAGGASGAGGADGGSAGGGDPFGGAAEGGEEGGADGASGESSDSGTTSPAGDSAGSNSRGGAVGAGGESSQGGAPTPPDVGDGSDDDIVARQLREAAENEDDPELRERLWDEYRAYKSGRRAPARPPADDDSKTPTTSETDPEGGSGDGETR